MENSEILRKRKIDMIKRMGAKNLAIQALNWIYFLFLMLVYWIPRMKTWETHGLWVIAASLTWILTRAGGNILLFYFDKKRITLDHIAGVLASFFIIPMLFQVNIYESKYTWLYFIISLFTSVIVIFSVFRKPHKNSFINIVKMLSVGILGCIYYWFLYSIIMDFSKNSHLYHKETGGIMNIILSIAIGMIVFLLQIFSFFVQRKLSSQTKVLRMMLFFTSLILMMDLKIFAWGGKVHQKISEYSLRYSISWETDFFNKLNLDK